MSKSLPKSVELQGEIVVTRLLSWYGENRRDLPWREPNGRRAGEIRDPWSVLICEVMLQQTQTSRVTELLPGFLERFPDPAACAGATTAEILRAWRGLGYNNRAIRLQNCAREIIARYDGKVPDHHEELLSLPGIGPYTAGAILCFAYGRAVPLVEVNVVRTLSRVFFGTYDAEDYLPEGLVARVTTALMPTTRSADWNQALMDLGSTICTARSPTCGVCPVANECLSAGRVGDFALFHPVRRRKRREPRFLGRPVRLVRGEIVNILRDHEDGLPVSSIVDRILDKDSVDESLRRGVRRILDGLRKDGILVVKDIVSEGGNIGEGEKIQLPA